MKKKRKKTAAKQEGELLSASTGEFTKTKKVIIMPGGIKVVRLYVA